MQKKDYIINQKSKVYDTVKTFKLEQFLNALAPILIIELGIVIAVKLVQDSNALPLIFVTELGILTEVKPLQSLNV